MAPLAVLGPSRDAFTFREHYPPPDAGVGSVVLDERDLCPAG